MYPGTVSSQPTVFCNAVVVRVLEDLCFTQPINTRESLISGERLCQKDVGFKSCTYIGKYCPSQMFKWVESLLKIIV